MTTACVGEEERGRFRGTLRAKKVDARGFASDDKLSTKGRGCTSALIRGNACKCAGMSSHLSRLTWQALSACSRFTRVVLT